MCAIGVTFTPTMTGVRTGSLTFTDTAVGSPQTIKLSGTGKVTNAAARGAHRTSKNKRMSRLSRVVRDLAIGEPDYHPKSVLAIDRQGVRAVEFDSLIVHTQVFRRPA